MEAKKRNSIIIGTVLIIGAATFAYFYSRKKRGGDASSEGLPSSTPPSNSETKSPVKDAVKNNTPIKQSFYTKANDVLAGSVNGANNKLAYASGETNVYNMQSEKSFTAKKGDVLGSVVSARKTTSGGYIIYFIAKNGVKYWTYSGSVQIKTA